MNDVIPEIRLDRSDPNQPDLNNTDLIGIDLNRKIEQVPQTVGGFFRAVCVDRNNQVIFGLSFCLFSLQLLPHWYTPLIRSGLEFELLYVLLLILVIPLMFVVSIGLLMAWWVTRSDVRRRLRYLSRALCFLSCCCLLPLIFCLNLANASDLPLGSFARSFDSEVWKKPSSQDGSGDISERQKMLGDVIRKVVRNNTKAGIISELGPSQIHFDPTSDRDLTYCLGSERGMFAIDSEWLSIWFDAHGRATRYQLWTD